MTGPQAARTRQTDSPALWASITFTVGLAARLLMIYVYRPVAFSDTPSYRRLAGAVLGGFSKYDGTRTPGYPVFMALVGDDQRVWLVQLLLGLFTTLLLFFIGWKLTGKPWFGGLAGIAHTLNLGQLLFESNLLTESLTTFLLILSMVVVYIWLALPEKRTVWIAALIGLLSTLTLLVRPLFIYLPFYILIFLGFSSWLHRKRNGVNDGSLQATRSSVSTPHSFWKVAIAFLLPVAILLGGWLAFIHARYGDWSLTTMTGYHLIQHTGSYFEYVPDEYAALRDTYIKYRDAQVAQYGTQANTIWEAIPEMSRVSGYNFYDLSNVLAKLSIQLILKHPLLFVQNAIQGWWMFWRTSVYWSADALRYPVLAGAITTLIQIQRAFLFLINLIFILMSIITMIFNVLPTFRRLAPRFHLQFQKVADLEYFWFLAGTIWIASILQTLLDHGDNPRFLVPLQSLVFLWVAILIYQVTQRKTSTINPSAIIDESK